MGVSQGRLGPTPARRGSARHTAQLESAAAELLTEIRDERVTAWGQRDLEPGRPNRGAVHERIPIEIFMHPAMSVTLFDEVRPDGNQPIEQWVDWRGPNFSGVQFKTAEILAIWPPKRHDQSKEPLIAPPDQVSETAQAHARYVAQQFSAPFWTPWGTVSWVAYRDPDDFCVIENKLMLAACRLYQFSAIAMKEDYPEVRVRVALQTGRLRGIRDGVEMPREAWAGKEPWGPCCY
jgi:hypothetical protein